LEPETLQYLTTDEAARRLGVTRERVAYWIQSGKLPIAARTGVGFLLSVDTVDRIGPALAAGAPAPSWANRRGRKHKAAEASPDPVPLPCGCVPGRTFCRHGAILSAAVQLAEGFAAECDTPTYRGLARLAREALAEHLCPPAIDPDPASGSEAEPEREAA
jgi:excisionase family DNA binding protein